MGYQRLDTSCVPAYGNPCVCEDFDECAAKTHDCIQGKWPLYDFSMIYNLYGAKEYVNNILFSLCQFGFGYNGKTI